MLAVVYSDKFLKKAARLPARLLALADEREALFKQDPTHPSLRTHKLQGKEKGTRAFWVNQKYRIKFIFLGERAVLFLDIGTHDIYE